MNKHQHPVIFLTFLLFALLQFETGIVLGQSSFDFYEENGKVGMKDPNGKISIPAIHERLGWSKGLDLPVDNVVGYYDGKSWGLITTGNKTISAPRYYSLEAYHKNLIVASIKGRFSNELFYGVINSRGNVIVDFKYHSLTPIQHLIIVSERKEGKSNYGLLSQQGQVFLPIEFSKISYYANDLFVFAGHDNKKGIISEDGTIKIKATLDSIAPAAENYSLVFESGKVGAIDTAGQMIYSPLYKKIISRKEVQKFKLFKLVDASHELIKEFYCDSLFELSEDLMVVARNDFYEVLNREYEPIYRAPALTHFSAFRKNVIFQKDDRYHILKYDGVSVDPEDFDKVEFDDNYIYAKSGGRWYVFNKFGSRVSKRTFDSLIVGSNNLIPVQKNGYWGYIDHSGGIAIPIKFDQAGPFVGNMAEVNYLGSRRMINQFGEFIGDADYTHISIGKANTALVTKHGRTDLINYRGEVLFETFNQLTPHFFGYQESTEEGRTGLVSHLGEVILHPIYDSISAPHNRRYLVVRQGEKVGLANFKGFWILPLTEQNEEICHVGEGLISIKKNGQYGYVDFGQRLLIANRYEKTKPFTNDLAAVKLNDKWGFIDKKEKLVIQPNYTHVEPFKYGISLVRRGQKYGAIDPKGQVKISISFDSIYSTTHDFLLAKQGEKIGLFDRSGERLLQPLYTDIRPSKDDHFIVQRRGFSGLINALGKYSIPLKYLQIVEFTNGRYACLETIPEAIE